MKLTEIRAALREIEVSPVKTLGQNFLHDQNLARWLVDQAEISTNDYVVEVGPGLGALTELLVEKCSHVLAIEKDTRLANYLCERLKQLPFAVININTLSFASPVLFPCPRVRLLC